MSLESPATIPAIPGLQAALEAKAPTASPVFTGGFTSVDGGNIGSVLFYGGGSFAAGNTGWNYGMARSGVKLAGTNGGMVGWAAGSLDAPTDLGLCRVSAGVVEVNNGTPGTLATLRAASATLDGGNIGSVLFYGGGSFAAGNTGWNYGMARSGVKLAGTNGGMVGWAVGSLDAPTDLGLCRVSAGVMEVNNGTPGTLATLRAKLRIETDAAPASATDTGSAGQIRWDSGFVYVCTATDTWKRAALSTW